ncbi:MAG: hypothetical protein K8M05_11070 [Deltaproteobacteria bacterium]|nr:hypothetical protein [Kofleriaceae bacterium]
MRGTKNSFIGMAVAIVALYGACTDEVEGGDPDGLAVSGQVIDFATGEVLTGTASVSTRGLDPAPVVIVDGAAFAIEPIPANSIFHLLSAAPPTHRATYAAVEVIDGSLEGIRVPALGETYIASLATGFGVSPTAARGILLARAVDDAGAPRAGIPGSAFTVPPGASGPFFLDPQLQAAPGATATTASGWVVFFEIEPGLVGLTASANAQVTMEMAQSPVAPAAATIADVKITDGATVLPTNVSFRQQVRPIFQLRGCESCHSGSGPGRDLGNLTLDGSVSLIYRELVEELALTAGPKRVDLEMPEKSLVLTMPSAEDPPDRHPNVTFTGPSDRDYQLILVWIREGARDN